MSVSNFPQSLPRCLLNRPMNKTIMIVVIEPVYELRKLDLPLPRMTWLLPLLSGELQEASAELK